MPRIEQRTLYTLAELKAQFPDAYKAVHKRWVASCYRHGAPWCEEVHASREAVTKACGSRLTGAGPMAEDFDDKCEQKDAAWLLKNVLRPNGYVKQGKADFPGHCKWTGYCADDDMIEAVYKSMVAGRTLTQALRDLDAVVERHNEDDMEQQESEESMEANWGDNEFTEAGEDA